MAKRLTRADFAQMLSFGTFKPVGHAVLAYADEAHARAALQALRGRGFDEEDLLVSSSPDLFPKVQAQMPQATDMVGAQGYEVVLMKRYLALAGRGAWWVVAWAPDDDAVGRVKAVLAAQPAESGAHYGRLMIEDLSERVGTT